MLRKRIVSCILAAVLILCQLPVSVMAAGTGGGKNGRSETDHHPHELAYSKKNSATPVIEMQTPRISFGVTFCL